MTLPLMFLPLLLLQTPAPMPRPVPIVAEVNKGDKSPPAVWTEIPADPILTTLVNPAAAKWISVDDGCELRPAADGKSCVFAAAKAGRYRVIVVPETGEIMRVAVVVGKIDPVPPPAPPGPTPPPVDPLTAKFQAAYATDNQDAATKKKHLLVLIEIYKQAAKWADSKDVSTCGQLAALVNTAKEKLEITGLTDLRVAIVAEVKSSLEFDVPLTDATRAKAKDVFTKIMNGLKGIQ